MPRWGNRLAKIAIIVVLLGVVGATGWLAGHGAATPEAPPDSIPAADLSPQVIKVEEGEIVSRLTVDANVKADPPVEIRPDRTGVVTAVYRKQGQRVNKGESLLAIRVEGAPSEGPSPGSGDKAKEPKPVTKVLTAPAAGRLVDVTAKVGQEVSPSAAVGGVDQGRFMAVAAIASKEVYKLYNRPKSIKLAIDHGPAPFSCKLLAYGAGAAPGSAGNSGNSGGGGDGGDQGGGPGGPGDSGDSGGSGGDQVEVTCRIPSRHRVFAGIRGKMSITTDSVPKAVLIPLSAVLGEADKGQVTVVKDGKHEVRTVKLGINDGEKVQVVDGLKVGEQILDRAPQDPAFTGPPGEGGEEGPPDSGSGPAPEIIQGTP